MAIKSATAYIDWEEFEGDTLQMPITWKDPAGVEVDFTSYTAKMEIRLKAGDATALLTLTNGNGITLGNSTNNIFVEVTDAQTFTLGKGKKVYDIEMTAPDGTVNTWISGTITLVESVTKA